jgi:hypothetical protein
MDIDFAFDNRDVLDILKKRGKSITKFEFDKLDKLDHKLIKLILNTEEYERLTRPVCAFIIFK